MIQFQNMEFATKKELFKFLADNKDKLIATKRAELKKKDMPILINPTIVFDAKLKAKKESGEPIDATNLKSLKVVAIINTTNFLDSHMDLHLPGLWNKSLQDNRMIMHLQEHEMDFDKIIADGKQLKAYTKPFKWSELGYDYKGETEALVFESEILKSRNPFMLNQYANGWVKNHSVGMMYVKMDMAINDEEMPNYFEAWQKYYPQIVNPEMANERGYFWYVLEAKCVEGSAVPIGSNSATPTLNISKSDVICSCGHSFDYNSVSEAGMGYVNCPSCGKAVTQKNQPSKDTDNILKPSGDTSKEINYEYLIKNLK